MARGRDLGCIPEFDLEEWLANRGNEPPIPAHQTYEYLTNSEISIFGKPVNDLVDQLNGTDRISRLWAIKTLGIVGKDVEPVLIQALSEADRSVAFWAAMAFENYEDRSPEALDALRNAMANATMPVRVAAARTLYKVDGPEKTIPVFLDGLKDPNGFVRLRAVEAIEHLHVDTPEVHAALEQAEHDDNQYVTRIAAHALTS